MPYLKCREDGNYYIRVTDDYTSANTYEITKQGAEIIKSGGNEVGEFFFNRLFSLVCDLGHISKKSEDNLDAELKNSDAYIQTLEQQPVKERVDILIQIVETHDVEALYPGEAGRWVYSILGESGNLIRPLLSTVARAAGYKYMTIITHSSEMGDDEKALEIALCSYLKTKWFQDSATFKDDYSDESNRNVLGIDRDVVFIETPEIDTHIFELPKEIPGEINDKLKNELNSLWERMNSYGFVKLTSMEVEDRYGAEFGIVLPRSRLDDFPVDYSARSANIKIPPNELADLTDGFSIIYRALPRDADLLWKFAINSILIEEEGLASGNLSYRKQYAKYNDFNFAGYRTVHGDGDIVTDFPAITTSAPLEQDEEYFDGEVQLPVSPESGRVIPINPDPEELPEAFAILNEFPTDPGDENDRGVESNLLDPNRFPGVGSNGSGNTVKESINRDTESKPGSSIDDGVSSEPESDGEQSMSKTESEKTVLRQEIPGEMASSTKGEGDSKYTSSTKYDDHQAERAHRRAQQRDPSEVVELGEEILLVLKEVDYSSPPATIMGTKNSLKIFVNQAPQDLEKYDTIRVKIVDYGGKNRSAQAVFVDYNR
ncbi:hypothetical protein [Halorientalis regularis]|uniref:Uncharacterized protein n=1 Tax=Halorientalis regularis TaxID=660518 RepID=A0A1G7GFK1_9EURY|nr:hypothetical protein [Halorientalis regularis]SDE86875.1 hypothetical protein SAMN05216218_10219 [Halorientalis regularis]